MIPALADPSGPPDTRPPNKPGTPPPPKDLATQLLAAIDEGLIVLLGLSVSLPPATDRVAICGEEILKHRLRMARLAVADLRTYAQTPACQLLSSAAAVAGGPVKSLAPTDLTAAGSKAALPRADRAGGPPAPGADVQHGASFSTPERLGPPRFEIGTGPVYDALLRGAR